MKILIVSWSILPSKGGSSVIVENLAQNFDRDELIVLGGKEPLSNPSYSRSSDSPRFIYFPSELYLFGRGYRYFTWYRRWMYQPLVDKIKSVIKEENIEYVIGVYPNPFYCLAACEAAIELNIPFSSYFHNTYIENVAITDPKASEIQNKIFSNSEYIYVMSSGMQKFYEGAYGLTKFKPLVHTFNSYPAINQHPDALQIDPQKIKLVAIGNFNESNIEATARFVRALSKRPEYELHLYTHVPMMMLKQRGIDIDAIVYRGFVNHDRVHDALQEFDLCLLTHGFTGGYGKVEYETIFPTRTIPLLLSGKPIIAHSPKGSFLNDFIEDNGCAILIDQPDESVILDELDRLCSDKQLREDLVQRAIKTADQFYGPKVAAQLKTDCTNHLNQTS